MSWKHLSDSGPAGGMSRRVLSQEDLDAVNDVLDAAAEWRAGRLPWQEAANVGTWHSPAKTRALAIATNPSDDPRWHDLMALLDVLIDMSGHVRTNHGCYSSPTLGEYDVVVHIHPQEGRVA